MHIRRSVGKHGWLGHMGTITIAFCVDLVWISFSTLLIRQKGERKGNSPILGTKHLLLYNRGLDLETCIEAISSLFSMQSNRFQVFPTGQLVVEKLFFCQLPYTRIWLLTRPSVRLLCFPKKGSRCCYSYPPLQNIFPYLFCYFRQCLTRFLLCGLR